MAGAGGKTRREILDKILPKPSYSVDPVTLKPSTEVDEQVVLPTVEIWPNFKNSMKLGKKNEKIINNVVTFGQNEPICDTEAGVSDAICQNIFSILEKCGIVKKNETIRPGKPMFAVKLSSLRADGYFSNNEKGRVYLVLEFKKYLPENIENELIEAKEGEKEKAKFTDPFRQIYQYMKKFKVKYGVVSTYTTSWFLRLDEKTEKTKETLFISESIAYNSTKPTALKCYACIINMSRNTTLEKIKLHSGGNKSMAMVDVTFPIVSVLGYGKFGAVFRSEWEGNIIAVKQIFFENNSQSKTEARNEVKIYDRLLKLQGEYIPKLLYKCINDRRCTIGTEIMGKPIDVGELQDDEKKEIVKVLKKIHQNGVLHGHITAYNIVRKEKNFYFIDFDMSTIDDKLSDEEKLRELKELHSLLGLEIEPKNTKGKK